MVAIFTGLGTGFSRGSGAVLGAAGLLGGASLGRSGQAVMVNAANGNLVIQRQDEMLVGRGPDADLVRTYNSQADGTDDNGDHWLLNVMPRLFSGDSNRVFGQAADGTVTEYDWNGSAYMANAEGTGARDYVTFDGTWRLTRGATGTVEVYGQPTSAGMCLTQETDTNGNSVTYYCNDAGRPSWITTANGEALSLAWNGANLVSLQTFTSDGPQTSTYYQYDGLNRLTQVTVDLSPADNSITDGRTYVTTYSYVGDSRLVATIDETDGTQVAFGYQGDHVHTITQTIDYAHTQTTTIDYGNGYTNVTDPTGQVTRLDYDGAGRLTRITLPAPGWGAAQSATQFGYDGLGNVITVTDALNQATHFTYDGNGNLLTTTDPLGNVTSRTYGSRSELLTETVAGADGTRATTRYVYDSRLNLHYEISAAGDVTQYERDGFGQIASTRRFSGNAFPVQNYAPGQSPTEAEMASWTQGLPDLTQAELTTVNRDGRGDVSMSVAYGRTFANGNADISDGFGLVYSTYDQHGRLLSSRHQNENSVSYAYDGLGRMVSSTDLNGGTTSITFNDAAHQTVVITASSVVTVSTYSRAGQLLTSAESGSYLSGGTTGYLYDADGRLRVATDPTGRITYYVYDALGRKVGEANSATSGSWVLGNFTEYRYDLDGRLSQTINYANRLSGQQLILISDQTANPDISQLRPPPSDSDIWSATVYDADGRVSETIDGTGAVVTIDYDGQGNAVRQTAYANRLAAATIGSIRYNPPSSRVLPVADASIDRVTRTFHDADGRVIATVDGAGYVTRISYDGVGNKVAESQYANAVTDAGVQSWGSLDQVLAYTPSSSADRTTRWVYDRQGFLVYTIDPAGYVTEFGYHGRVSNAGPQYSSSEVTTFGDAIGERRVTTVYAGAIGGLGSYTIDSVRGALAGAGLAGNGNNRVSYDVYDAAGRLAYAIDAAGDVTGNVYDYSGRLISQTRYAAQVTLADLPSQSEMDNWAAANANGAADRTTRNIYDAADLRFVVDAEGYATRHDYDPAHRLVADVKFLGPISVANWNIGDVHAATLATSAGNITTTYVYDAQGRLTDTYDGEGVRHTTLYYANGTVEWTLIDWDGRDDQRTRYDYDAAGRTIRTFESAYRATERLTQTSYNAFGEVAAVTDPDGHMTARFYDRRGLLVREESGLVSGLITTGIYVAVDPASDGTNRLAKTSGGDNWNGDAYSTEGTSGDFVLLVRPDQANRHFMVGISTQPNASASWENVSYALWFQDGGTVSVSELGNPFAGSAPSYQSGDTFWMVRGGDTLSYYKGADLAAAKAAGAFRSVTVSGTFYLDSSFRTEATSAHVDFQTAPSQSFAYNAFGEQVRATDARGFSTYSYYDNEGRVVAVRDPASYTTETRYTGFGDVDTVTRYYQAASNTASISDYPQVSAHALNAVSQFAYDRLGRLTTSTDAEGHSDVYQLDTFGDRVRATNKSGGVTTSSYDRRGLLTSETAPDSNATTTYQYDARGNMVRKVEAAGRTEQRATSYEYDGDNRLKKQWLENAIVIGAPGSYREVHPTESYYYDRRGNLVQSTDANGASTFFYYDDHDQKIAEVSPVGILTTYALDGDGNVVSTRIYAVAVNPTGPGGSPPGPQSGDCRETDYRYDALNRLTSTTVSVGQVGAWDGYNYNFGQSTATTTYTYDRSGNLVRQTDANGASTYTYYDGAGGKIGQVDAEGYKTTWQLDSEGNVLSERRYANAVSAVGGAALPGGGESGSDRITNFTYDRVGNRLSEERLNVEAYAIRGDTGDAWNASGSSVVRYTYNALGEVLSKTEASGEAVDGAGQLTHDQTTYEYDHAGRLIAERRPYTHPDLAGDGGATPELHYHYNSFGELDQTVENGRVTSSIYDAAGRLVDSYDATGAQTHYWYDAAGNKLGQTYYRVDTNSDGTGDGGGHSDGQRFKYDAAGRLVEQATITTDGTNQWHDVGPVNGIVYDAFGDVTARTVGGVVQDSFDYDRGGHLWRSRAGDGVTRFFVYDGNGNQTLEIDDAGRGLAGQSLDTALSLLTGNGQHRFVDVLVDGVNATITQYSARNLATATIQPQRQLAAGVTAQLATYRQYNGFGELRGQSDASGGNWTWYDYNTMGRLTQVTHPSLWIATEDGGGHWGAPIDGYRYDLAGRLIATVDANGNVNRRTLIAGTGYGGKDALVWREFHADGGIVTNSYDVFGNQTATTDAMGRRTAMQYDAAGRLIEVDHAGGLVDVYRYDMLGNRIAHVHNVHKLDDYHQDVGVNDAELTYYDAAGRVVRQVAFGGATTTTTYEWQDGLATDGLGTFGGWQTLTTLDNQRTSTEWADTFGHVLKKIDFGDHLTHYSYDAGGRLGAVETASTDGDGGASTYYSYDNTGLVDHVATGTGSFLFGGWGERVRAWYVYDVNGRKTAEYTTTPGGIVGNATASYDALGRMTAWQEGAPSSYASQYVWWWSAGAATPPAASVTWTYDAAGNVREQVSAYSFLDADGHQGASSGSDQWFRYDAMSRVVTAGGTLSGGQIVRGPTGYDYSYDAAGERVTMDRDRNETATVYDDGAYDPNAYGGWGGTGAYVQVPYVADYRETYSYDAAGAVSQVGWAESGYIDNGNGTVTPDGGVGPSQLEASYTHDILGRLTYQTDYQPGGAVAYQSHSDYDGAGRVWHAWSQVSGQDSRDSYTSYGAAGDRDPVTQTRTTGSPSGTVTTSTTAYAWYGGAAASLVSSSGPGGSGSTSYSYDATGALIGAQVSGGRSFNASYTLDAQGQVIRRDETTSWGDGSAHPHQLWYRFDGREIGTISNDGASLNEGDYAASVRQERLTAAGTGPFANGASGAPSGVRFGVSPDPITSGAQGSPAGSYTVRGGDSLAGIAAQLWGDASLWYKLAQANGLSGEGGLHAGMVLSIPAGVMRAGNSATTFRPYDPAAATGDLSPTTPQPQAAQGHNKCGVFGAIVLAVVAIAVTVVSAGAAFAALTPGLSLSGGISVALGGSATLGLGAGALAGATVSGTAFGLATLGTLGAVAGSLVSQGIGVATGLQDRFDWGAVALAGVGAAAGGVAGSFIKAGGAFGAVARGLVGSTITQGIGVATGLQSKFDFAGVAGAGLAGFAGAKIGGIAGLRAAGAFTTRLASNTAAGLADAAARSLIDGTDFGDNVIAALPDVIGQTVGDAIAGVVERWSTGTGSAAGDGWTPPQVNIPQVDHIANWSPDLSSLQTIPLDLGDGGSARSSPRPDKPRAKAIERDIIVSADRVVASLVGEMDQAQRAKWVGSADQAVRMERAYEETTGSYYSTIPDQIAEASAILSNSPMGYDFSVFNIQPKSYMASLFVPAGVQTRVRGYTPSIWNGIRSSFVGATYSGIQVRNAAYSLFKAGYPDTAAALYSASIVMRVSQSIDWALTTATAAVHGRALEPMSEDRQTAQVLSLTAGAFTGMDVEWGAIRAAERITGPIAGGGAKLENLSAGEIARIQNAANRTGTPVTVVGSRANGTARANSDWDFVLPEGTPRTTRHSLTSSLPEGPRGLGEPRNQDFFLTPLDPTKPHIIFPPKPR